MTSFWKGRGQTFATKCDKRRVGVNVTPKSCDVIYGLCHRQKSCDGPLRHSRIPSQCLLERATCTPLTDNRILPSYFYNLQCSGHRCTTQDIPKYENRPIDSTTKRFMKRLNIFPGGKAPLADWGFPACSVLGLAAR